MALIMAKLWQSYGKGMAKLWWKYVWPHSVRMRRTDARLRRADAHNMRGYMVMEMDGFDGCWNRFMPG